MKVVQSSLVASAVVIVGVQSAVEGGPGTVESSQQDQEGVAASAVVKRDVNPELYPTKTLSAPL